MAKHSRYQAKVIKDYYRHREAIALQRLEELVTDLYLAEGKKRQRTWKVIATHLEKLGVKPARITYLQEQDNPTLVAQEVARLINAKPS